ncbi:MAG TPA: ArgR family transcriptional regulator [Candidatus Dormibacteraeota bacterium]|jgi:transcriptional regulator of arginine metabolism|nr:ArgR family transcriptional regulator [Candidatus Dormibacteraeota bacterium]
MTALKAERQRAILELVRSGSIHTQQDVASALTESGLGATQATVSRDIQELGLIRTPEGYRPPASDSSLAAHVVDLTIVQFLAVIRTPPGRASMVARAIDEAELAGLAGTVAGDDTIIAVLQNSAAGTALAELLRG